MLPLSLNFNLNSTNTTISISPASTQCVHRAHLSRCITHDELMHLIWWSDLIPLLSVMYRLQEVVPLCLMNKSLDQRCLRPWKVQRLGACGSISNKVTNTKEPPWPCDRQQPCHDELLDIFGTHILWHLTRKSCNWNVWKYLKNSNSVGIDVAVEMQTEMLKGVEVSV